jgi:hypothetical protein
VVQGGGRAEVVASEVVAGGVVLNFEVAGAHNYYVEGGALGHNCVSGGGLRGASTWGRPGTLAQHFRDHGGDFAAATAEEYAEAASNFFRRAQAERLPTRIDSRGVIRVYDPATNMFGAYNPSGTTRTFFRPTRGAAYWADQPGVAPWTP